MSMADLREIFFQECEDLIEAMADGLRSLDEALPDSDTINSVFRAVHSIKGGAGAFALHDLVHFAHGFETTLDGLRSNRLSLSPPLAKLLMQAGDHLSDLVAAAREGRDPDLGEGDRLAAELAVFNGDEVEEEISFTPMTLDFSLDLGGPLQSLDQPIGTIWEIQFEPDRALYANGHDPALLFRDLASLGKLEVTLDHAALPPIDQIDWQQSYFSWRLRLTSEHSRAEIEDIFDFVVGLCRLQITEAPPRSEPSPEAEPNESVAPAPPSPEPLARSQTAATMVDAAAIARRGQTEPVERQSSESVRPRPTIRVDLDRVDRLINVVGELVINQAMLAEAIESAGLGSIGSDVGMGLDELKQLSREIQEGVMAIRAQPVKPLFDRMYRILRECAEASGKSARLVIVGDNTEVDKTVVEKLADPLTHMIRNAVDHGLESAHSPARLPA